MKTFLNTYAHKNTEPNVSEKKCVKTQISYQIPDPYKQDLRCENEVHCFLQHAISVTILARNAIWIMGSAPFSNSVGFIVTLYILFIKQGG